MKRPTRNVEERLLWPSRGYYSNIMFVALLLLCCTSCRAEGAQGYTDITFPTHPTSLQYTVADTITTLPCTAQGVNQNRETVPLSIIFYRNGVEIPIYPPGDYQYLYNHTTTGLKIIRTSYDDDGATFQCKLFIERTIMTRPTTLRVTDGRPGAVSLTEHSLTSTSYTVTWDQPPMYPETVPLLGYNTSIFTMDGSLLYSNISREDILLFTFDNLQPNTEYKVLIVAFSVYGSGDEADLLTIKTAHDPVVDGSVSQSVSVNVIIIVVVVLMVILIVVSITFIALMCYMNKRKTSLSLRKTSEDSSEMSYIASNGKTSSFPNGIEKESDSSSSY